MKRPAFQFYPADWRSNAKLRRCSDAARGAWMDVLCVLHDSDEYGVVRYPLAELARAAGVPLRLLKELATKDVLKGADTNAPGYVFTPFHAGKAGQAVTLIEDSAGPCWYSTRFVRDEHVRQKRGGSTRFTEENQPPNNPPKPPIGGRQGDGASIALASASSQEPLPNDSPSTLGDYERAGDVRALPPNVRAWQAIREFAGYGPGQAGSASDPRLTAAVDAGVTVAEFAAVAHEAAQHNPPKPFAWVVATAAGRHRDANNPGANHADRPQRGRVGLADRNPRPVRQAEPDQHDAIDGEAVRIDS